MVCDWLAGWLQYLAADWPWIVVVPVALGAAVAVAQAVIIWRGDG